MHRTIQGVALCLCFLGCATFQNDTGEPDYAADAQTNFNRGNEAMESSNYLEAEKYFEFVRAKYPFLEAAREAELRIGDAQFEQEKFIEARDTYNNFVKLHPSFPRVDYAAYRAAYTYYRQI